MKKLLAVSATALIASMAVAAPAFAAVNNPPANGHSILSFPQRDFISAAGYNQNDTAVVHLFRGGVEIGTSDPITPQDDPKTPGFDGTVEVNHPGGGCWVGHTPDIMPGDEVRVTTGPDINVGDATTTANVIVTQQATKVDNSTVTVKGTAAMADGTTPIPLDQIEARLVANKQAFVLNGRRTLRASGVVGGGDIGTTLTYDAPGSTSWTATFTGLDKVSTVDGLSDADRAVQSESRGMWLGINPATTAEGTIYEVGGPTPATAGPAAPCAAPLAQYGVLNSNAPAGGINSAFLDPATGKDLTLSGASQDASSVSVVLSDGAGHSLPAVTATPTPATGAQSWSVTIPRADVATLSDGKLTATGSYTLTAGGTIPGQNLTVQKDTVAPGAPTGPSLDPASNSGSTADNLTKDSTPTFTGNAEAGSTVDLFDGATKVGSAKADGGSYSITTSNTLADGDHLITAKATDAAGNVSVASGSLNVSIDTKSPVVTANPGAGTYSPTQKITLNSEPGAQIYFTRDDTTPGLNADGTPSGTTVLYSTALSFPSTTTLKYFGVDAAGNQSQVATQVYTIDSSAPTVRSNLGTGSYNGTQSFTLSSEAGAKIYFTKGANPADPTQSSTLYTGTAIPVSSTQTIKAIAVDGAGNVSPVISRTITIRTASGVSLSVATTNLKLGKSRTISGMVTPAQPAGSKVKLTIVKPGTDVVKTLSLVNSRYSFTYKPPVTGTYKVQVSFAQDVDNLAGKSVIKSFKVVS